eukprot:7415754-Alexandrium_andersonii.AAC.1
MRPCRERGWQAMVEDAGHEPWQGWFRCDPYAGIWFAIRFNACLRSGLGALWGGAGDLPVQLQE